MDTSRMRIIINPTAGSVDDGTKTLEMIRELLPEAEIAQTTETEGLTELAKRAVHDGCDTVVAAGGDGTLNGVLNGLGSHLESVRLGLIPLGTGNDFARTINIPTVLEEAVAALRENRVQRIDVVRVSTASTNRLMLNVSAGGFSTKVSELADGELKDTWGPLCYARSFIAALPELDHYHTEIHLDQDEYLRTPAYNIIIANGRYVAGGIPIAPEAILDDGLAEIVILPVASVPQLAILAPTILLGKHLTSDLILFRRARKITITSTPSMRFNTDGELLPAGPVTFEVLPGALQFIAGPPPAPDGQSALTAEPQPLESSPSTRVQ